MRVETTKTGSVRPGGARERLHRLGGVVVEERATVDVPVGMPASRGMMGHAPGHSVVSPMCAPLVGGTTTPQSARNLIWLLSYRTWEVGRELKVNSINYIKLCNSKNMAIIVLWG